jgi:putative flippase GtrA
MDQLDTTPRTHWFVIVGFFAIFVAMAVLPAAASIAANFSAWAAVATMVGIAAIICFSVVETWKHLPH